jgi:predicted TIM-barrel fold metal-dependent hydrolase
MNPLAIKGLSRRSFVQTAALAALAPAGCTSLPDAKSNGLIDAHVHLWTPDTTHYPLSPDFSKAKDMVPASFTPEELFAQCRPQGVNRIVLIQMSFYTFDNRYMLDSIAQHPGSFRGVAIVDESKSDVRETMKRLASQGVRGFRIYTDKAKAEAWPDSAGMKAMWSYGADAGLSMCLLASPDSLPAVHRMCQAYPRTGVVIDHFARIGMKGPVQESDLDNLRRLAEHEHTHVKTSAFYALGRKRAPYTDMAPLIQKLRDAYGAQRLMWGSDCPFQLQDGHNYADSMALIRDRLEFLSPEDKAWMLGKTAERVFFR